MNCVKFESCARTRSVLTTLSTGIVWSQWRDAEAIDEQDSVILACIISPLSRVM